MGIALGHLFVYDIEPWLWVLVLLLILLLLVLLLQLFHG